MFAICALVCFLLALFHAHVGDLDLVVLGLAFIALHLIWSPVGLPWNRRQAP